MPGEARAETFAKRRGNQQIDERLPERIPAALSVDGKLLTAGELLLLFASAVREESPSTRPIAVPEPNESGLGWGKSTLP